MGTGGGAPAATATATAAPAAAPASGGGGGATPVFSPFEGKTELVEINVKVGDKVNEGQVVAAVEAMKAKHEVGAPCAGTVASVDAALGDDIEAGQRPQIVVPAGEWQSAESLGEWTLVGCTVSPGFVWEGFEMAGPGWEPGRER